MYFTTIDYFIVILLLNLLRGSGAYEWRLYDFKKDSRPLGAVFAGSDVNGDSLYVGRIHRDGEILPGKVIPARNIFYTSYGGKEIPWGICEVLVQDALSWQSVSNGEVPKEAVEAGKTYSGETLYYGRTSCNGYMTPGKIHPSHKKLYYSFNGVEYDSSDYEVLIEIK